MGEEFLGPPPLPFGWARDYVTKSLHVIDQVSGAKWEMPAVILAYSTIDAVASLGRQPDHDESTPEDFKSWVRGYLLPAADFADVTVDELWASRCGLLHAYSPEARAVRLHGVRRVCFITGHGVEWPLGGPQPDVFLAPHLLFDALRAGAEAFFTDAAVDPALRMLVEERERDLFVPWRRDV